MQHENHTQLQYMSLAQAFDYLNATLFTNCPLPSVLVTFQRHAKSKGYYASGMFQSRSTAVVGSSEGMPLSVEGETIVTTDEIALNPDAFVNHTDAEIFSTLAHEMVHLWQHVHGKAPKRAYHNRQWAEKMKSIGLQPSDTGMPGGKETGARMTHYIANGGPFHLAYLTLAEQQITIQWQSAPRTEAAKKKTASKTKYTCASCEQNAWAKPDTRITCADCDMPMLA